MSELQRTQKWPLFSAKISSHVGLTFIWDGIKRFNSSCAKCRQLSSCLNLHEETTSQTELQEEEEQHWKHDSFNVTLQKRNLTLLWVAAKQSSRVSVFLSGGILNWDHRLYQQQTQTLVSAAHDIYCFNKPSAVIIQEVRDFHDVKMIVLNITVISCWYFFYKW